MSQPASKRARTLSTTSKSVDSVLHDENLLNCLFSFASAPTDLCSLDVVSRGFREAAARQWKDRTKQRFGLTNGKDDWITGVSLLKKPILVEMQDGGDFGYGARYDCSADVATNGSIVVAVSDCVDDSERNFPAENTTIGVRDACTLNFSKILPSPIIPFKVGICGRVGSEVIVTSNGNEISARRGNDVQKWHIRDLHPDDGFTGTQLYMANGIPLLGCETHLILLAVGHVLLFRVNQVGQEPELLSLCQSVRVIQNEEYRGCHMTERLSWGNNTSQFVFFNPQTRQISIWELDTAAETVSQVQAIDVPLDLFITNMVLTEDFVAATCESKKIHVWDRSMGARLHHVLCDVGQSEELPTDDLIYPLYMVAKGNLLISTSHLGHALCVWNMKTGQLLKRHNDAEDQRLAKPLPRGEDVTSMTYLGSLNAFVCMSGEMVVWAFPTCKRQRRMLDSIRRREDHLKAGKITPKDF